MQSFIKALLILVLAGTVASCSGGESNVEVSLQTSPLPLIPAEAKSCLAVRNQTSDSPAAADISPFYFKIPRITFTRKEVDKALIISLIRIKINIPGSTSGVDCTVGGDSLAALAKYWWDAKESDGKPEKEAFIPPGQATFQTDCALYCGGIAVTGSFVATGTVEIFGLERNVSSEEEVPVITSSSISVQSF